jgi:hypothetical protein
MSTYTGTFTGPNTASGGESGVFQGNQWSLAWTITSPTPLFTAAAPVAVATASEAPTLSGSSDPIVLTPEVKQAIAQEVRAQLRNEKAAAQGGQNGSTNQNGDGGDVPPALDPARRTFVVANNLSVISNGQECELSAGDVITRMTDTPDADNMVNASVSASKKQECAPGQTVAVKVDDLQEMQNHFAEQCDKGLTELAKKQGNGGIPKAPGTRTTPSDVPPPPPDSAAEKSLEDQQHAADQTESQVSQEVGNQ